MRITLTEKIILDPGYRQAYRPARDESVRVSRLAQYTRGQRIQVRTRVEKRRGLEEADLIRLMQHSGVGRPSTYASTLEALKQHRYIEEENGRLVLTGRGRAALEFVRREYPGLFDISFTAEMERMLDDLESGRRKYREVVEAVWKKVK